MATLFYEHPLLRPPFFYDHPSFTNTLIIRPPFLISSFFSYHVFSDQLSFAINFCPRTPLFTNPLSFPTKFLFSGHLSFPTTFLFRPPFFYRPPFSRPCFTGYFRAFSIHSKQRVNCIKRYLMRSTSPLCNAKIRVFD